MTMHTDPVALNTRESRVKWPIGFLKPRLHDTTCYQTGCQSGCIGLTRFDNRLYRVNGVSVYDTRINPHFHS